MAQSIDDLYYPEVSPGKFLARSWRWSRHGYLIDAKTKDRLKQSAWVFAVLFAAIVFAITFTMPEGRTTLSLYGWSALALGLLLVPYLFFCRALIRRGEKVELASIDPKLLKQRSVFEVIQAAHSFQGVPKWLLAPFAVLLGLLFVTAVLLIALVGIVKGWPHDVRAIIGIMICLALCGVICWRMLSALFYKRAKG
jgi:hypothetical protein